MTEDEPARSIQEKKLFSPPVDITRIINSLAQKAESAKPEDAVRYAEAAFHMQQIAGIQESMRMSREAAEAARRSGPQMMTIPGGMLPRQ